MHTGYWFWQGFLPKADGTRAAFHGHTSGAQWFVRVSWDCVNFPRHDFNVVKIEQATGEWDFERLDGSSFCDWTVNGTGNFWNNFGCQNPVGLAKTWANCHHHREN
jgi:hypothetical protein